MNMPDWFWCGNYEYYLVVTDDPNRIDDIVNSKAEMGYIPFGSASFSDECYTQAMIRPKGACDSCQTAGCKATEKPI